MVDSTSSRVVPFSGLCLSVAVGAVLGLTATAKAGCVYIDACSEDLTCRPAGMGLWQTTSPSAEQL